MEGRFIISHVSELGEPLQSREHARKFVNQCGVLVRDNILIHIREWKKSIEDFPVSYVPDREKDELGEGLMAHFQLPEGIGELVKSWVMKKMAKQL